MDSNDDKHPIGARALSKLRWRCRRGLLENDLFIERFFQRHGASLSQRQADGLESLMELSDNDLLDLLLRRKEIDSLMDREEVRDVLAMIQFPVPEAGLGQGTFGTTSQR